MRTRACVCVCEVVCLINQAFLLSGCPSGNLAQPQAVKLTKIFSVFPREVEDDDVMGAIRPDKTQGCRNSLLCVFLCFLSGLFFLIILSLEVLL